MTAVLLAILAWTVLACIVAPLLGAAITLRETGGRRLRRRS